jgi:hypothetical protein
MPESVPAVAKLPELLTEAEFCELARIKPQTASVWRSSKRYALPYVKVGRLVRYRREDVLAFLESRTIRPAQVA